MHQNILQLFAQIPAAKVIAYLEQKGWQRLESANEELVEFDSPEGAAAEPCRVAIFATEAHPQFRRQLPNVIFAVCLFEDRPALEIANEIYDLRLAAAQELATETSAWQHTVIVQQRTCSQYVWLEPSTTAFAWEPGDRLEILLRGSGAPPRFILCEDGLRLLGGTSESCRVFLGSATPADPRGVRQIVAEEVDRLTEFDLPESREQFTAQMAPILARIEFDLPTVVDDSQTLAPEAARRQIALLAATFTKVVRTTPQAQTVLWRIVLRLAASAGICLELHAMALEDFWLTAADDAPELPRGTLRWLEQHAVDPRREALAD